jgi:L-alanine-DL-glutamate epimerase-like enolase superfamily enzyme
MPSIRCGISAAAGRVDTLNINLLVDTAAAHFFASTNVIFNEIKAPNWVIADPVQKGTYIKDGFVHVPDGPGLGIEVDDKYLEKHKI